MADGTNLSCTPGMERVHKDVARLGYAIATDQGIGLPATCGSNLLENYFNGGALRHDQGDFPIDRERARDVILYEWNDEELTLKEYETIAIWDRSDIEGERIHKRVELLQDSAMRQLVETFIRLVPENRRRSRGTFGVNLFRTHSDVVSKPHQDAEEFIILYVLDRIGGGADSYLYKNDESGPGVADDAKPVMWRQLNPGELMIFEDAKFKHGATPIKPLEDGGETKRDVLVCTIDYASTYLERSDLLKSQ